MVASLSFDFSGRVFGTDDVPAVIDGFEVVVLGMLSVMASQHMAKVVFVRLQEKNNYRMINY